jgi:hypothetical protein
MNNIDDSNNKGDIHGGGAQTVATGQQGLQPLVAVQGIDNLRHVRLLAHLVQPPGDGINTLGIHLGAMGGQWIV